MISRLGYAILALLRKAPSTGYELAARTRRPPGYFWAAQHGQIYPELQKLLDGGYVRFKTSQGPGPHDKKVYSLTEAGRTELALWVTRPPVTQHVGRDDVLLKAYACWAADPAAASGLFRGQIAEHEQRLDRYLDDWKSVESRHGGPPPAMHPDFGSYAILWYGIGYERLRIGWLRWLVEFLSAEVRPA